MAGGVDKDTVRNWTWKVIFAIVELETHVVSANSDNALQTMVFATLTAAPSLDCL